MALQHRSGGTIERLTHVGHETYKGVASWFFVGDVAWRDGSRSESIEIQPNALCCDTDEDHEQVKSLLGRLNDYLGEAGEWHEPKSKRDGRMYSWTPKQPNRQVAL